MADNGRVSIIRVVITTTIISTVFVPEGIAMAADSRLTGFKTVEGELREVFTISDNAQKLVLIRDSTIGVAFCGDALIDGKTVADFVRIFDITKVSGDETVETVASTLNQCLREQQVHQTHFMVAGFDNDEPFVYLVSATTCERLNYRDRELHFGAQWAGEMTAPNALAKNIPINWLLMPLPDAADFAEFIVDLSVKYERFQDGLGTCGGPIDVLVITKDFAKFLRHKILNP